MINYAAARHGLQNRARRAAAHLPCEPGHERHHRFYWRSAWLQTVELTIEEHHWLHRFLTYIPDKMCFQSPSSELLDTIEKHDAHMARVLAHRAALLAPVEDLF